MFHIPGRFLINEIIPNIPNMVRYFLPEYYREVNKFYGQYLMVKFCSDLMN